MTGGKALPKEIADQIIDRTDGVPLFIEELTKTVVESGCSRTSAITFHVAGPVSPLAIPTSLNASLLARLDRLAPVREVAQIGAALGRQFSHELISAVARMPQQQLDDALARFVQRRADLPARDAARRGVHLQARAGTGCRLQHLAAQPAPATSRQHRAGVGGAVSRYQRNTARAARPPLHATRVSLKRPSPIGTGPHIKRWRARP